MTNILAIIFLTFSLFLTGCAEQTTQDQEAVTVWHWMSDREEAFQELAARYEKLTGTRVKFDLYAPSEAYAQKVKAAAQTDTLPDIFGVLGEKRDLASFIKSGYVRNLTGAMSRDEANFFRNALFERAVAVNRFERENAFGVKPGIYGVPLDTATIQMIYNKDLFRKAGLDPENPPETWSEFTKAGRQLIRSDVPVLVGGFGEVWMLDALSSNWAMNLMGKGKVFKTYAGEVPYTDPDWIRVLSFFRQMTEEGIIVKGAVTMVNKAAERTFANGRAAIAFNGSWSLNVFRGMNPDLDLGVMLPPKISTLQPMWVWGGAASSFMVNERSPRREEAFAFLKWVIEEDQQVYLAGATNNLPANRHSLKQIPPLLAEFADDIDNAMYPNAYPVRELPRVVEAWTKGIQSIMIGEKTPEQVAQEVQALKERELAKKQNKG